MEASTSQYIDIAVPIRGRCGAATCGVEYFRNATSAKGVRNGCCLDSREPIARNECPQRSRALDAGLFGVGVRRMPALGGTMPSSSPRSTPACPPISDVRGHDPRCPLYVDSCRPLRANTGHAPAARRTAQVDPKHPQLTVRVSSRCMNHFAAVQANLARSLC
jgi:hypothetical protein